MAIPILNRRKTQREAQIEAITENVVSKYMEKALAQEVAQAASAPSGATYSTRFAVNPSSPFSQTGGGIIQTPLPRPDASFNSLFGPGYPFIPDPLDPTGPNGRTMPRRNQYLVAYNLQLVDRQIPWSMLTGLAENCDVVNRCIQLVQDGLVGREWSWGFSDAIIEQIMAQTGEANHARALGLARAQYGEELDRVKAFFARPDVRSNYSFSQWMTEMIWQHLVYDAVVIYPQYNLGGQIYSFNGIDGATIKILKDNQGFPPEAPAPAYQQILYGFPRGEFQAANDSVDGEYISDQLAYYMRRPRPSSVYGFPQVEEVMTIATTYLARQAWMAAEYTHGAMPRTFIKTAETETWTPEQMAYYEQILNDRLSGQIQRRQNMFILRPGFEPMWAPQIEEHYKSDYDNFLITQMGSKFGVPSALLGIQAKAGLSGGKQMAGEEDQTEHFVFTAMINFFIDILNDLARKHLGVGDEITATCQDPGGSEEDILQQAQADAAVIGFGGMTINDYRAKKGLPLYDMPEADEPFIEGQNPPVFLKGQLAVQGAQQQAELAPPPPPAPPGSVGPDGLLLGGPIGSAPGSPAPGGAAPLPASPGGITPTFGAGGAPATPSPMSTQKAVRDTGELATFERFAAKRIANGNWRDFDFQSVDAATAAELNAFGRGGRLDVIRKSTAPKAAGIVVKAKDTGRVLMVQRSIDNKNHNAAGLWEFPGGCLDDSDDGPFDAAKREWEEEVGCSLPEGDTSGSWTATGGRYTAYVYTIGHETDIHLKSARSALDGSGDAEIENVAWWNPKDIVGNPAMRVEVQGADWALLGHAKAAKLYELAKSGVLGAEDMLKEWYKWDGLAEDDSSPLFYNIRTLLDASKPTSPFYV